MADQIINHMDVRRTCRNKNKQGYSEVQKIVRKKLGKTTAVWYVEAQDPL